MLAGQGNTPGVLWRGREQVVHVELLPSVSLTVQMERDKGREESTGHRSIGQSAVTQE